MNKWILSLRNPHLYDKPTTVEIEADTFAMDGPNVTFFKDGKPVRFYSDVACVEPK